MEFNDRVIPVIDWDQHVPYLMLIGDKDATPLDEILRILPNDISEALTERLDAINSRRLCVKANVPTELLHLEHAEVAPGEPDAAEQITEAILLALREGSSEYAKLITAPLLDACGQPRPSAKRTDLDRFTRTIELLPMHEGVRHSSNRAGGRTQSAFAHGIITFRFADLRQPPATEARDDA